MTPKSIAIEGWCFAGLITLVLTVLKLLVKVDLSWWGVFTPLLIAAFITLAIFGFGYGEAGDRDSWWF